MVLNNAHDFYINHFYAVDGQNSSKELKLLLDAACPGAGHQSAERGDAPKCHPDTRKAVVNDIMSWVDCTDSTEPLMWMSGPAGAGKSSIAQTVCEKCDAEKKLLASFFFSRSAVGTGRGDGNRLVPTIAIQLAIAIPESKSHILGKLEKDPLLLTYSVEDQMHQLILDPLAAILATLSNKDKIPYLVVIDGLDECSDRSMQAKIITMFAAIGSNLDIRLRCLIASRPELEIRNTFNAATCVRIILDAHYKPEDDIRIYLRSEFSLLKRNHTLKSRLSQDSDWPTSKEIDWLVDKSSGQFIYVSTIMKYLQDPRKDPKASLYAVIDHKIMGNEKNEISTLYSPLDALYKFILESAALNLQKKYQSIITVFQVLLFTPPGPIGGGLKPARNPPSRWPSRLRVGSGIRWSLTRLASFLAMTRSELELLLADLHSVLLIPESDFKINSSYNEYSVQSIRFYHASLGDFFKDPSRSGQFFIDEKGAHIALSQLCFFKLSKCRSSDDDHETVVLKYCRQNYLFHVDKSRHFPLVVYCFIRTKLLKMGVYWKCETEIKMEGHTDLVFDGEL